MSTLTTRIYGRRITQGQDVYGIPFVSVETADHSGYEVKRFPQGQWVADEHFVKAQFNIVEEMFGWSMSSEMRIDPFFSGQPVEDEDVEVCDCPSGLRSICQYPHI